MKKLLPFIVLSSVSIYADAVKLTDVEAKYNATAKVEASKALKQHIGLGFANTTGNTDTLNFSFEYDFTYTTVGINDQELKVAFDSSAYISENDDVRDNEEYKAWLRLEQVISNDWFGYISARWLKNEFRNYDSKTGLGIGIGKDVYKDATQELKLALGVSYNFEQYTDNTPDEDFAALTQYLQYTNELNDISSLYLKLGALENFEDFSNDYELSMVAGVKFAIAQSLNLSIEAEIDYDALPSDGYDKTDTKTLIKLGYDF
jgi:putative salt-induced outer membrane protein YdiY